MEGQQGLCLICGEEGGAPISTDMQNGSTLLESYVECLDRNFQGSNLGGNAGSWNEGMTCDGCGYNVSSVVNNMERMGVVKEEVSQLENSLHHKLRELKSTGQKVLLELEQIGKCMGDRNKASNLLQKEMYLLDVTEKASKAMIGTLSNLEEETFVKKWTCAEIAETPLQITSVTSLATEDGFEESEVFQVKTEPEDLSNDNVAPSTPDEPVLEAVIKYEIEPIRKTRQGVIMRTRTVSAHVPLQPLAQIAGDAALETEVIELGDEGEVSPASPLALGASSALHTATESGQLDDAPQVNMANEAIEQEEDEAEVPPPVPVVSTSSSHVKLVPQKESCTVKRSTRESDGIAKDDELEPRRKSRRIGRNPEVDGRTLEILSEDETDFNMLDRIKQNVLHTSIKHNSDVPLLKRLIKRGVNFRQVYSNGRNFIHFVVSSGCTPELIEFLTSEVLDVNAEDRNGTRPLSLLRNVNDLERKFCLFKVLVNAGADLPGRTPLHEYLSSGIEKSGRHFREVFEFISSKEKIGWVNVENKKELNETPLHLFLKMFEIDGEALEMICQEQVDFTKVDKNGYGCLHYAIIGGNWNPECLQILVDKGADVNGVTTDEETLLHFAVKHLAPLETIEFLLGKGLDIAAVQYRGYTALDIAIEKGIRSEMLSKLLIWTFDASVRRSRTWNKPMPMLHLAIEHGTPDIVEHMLLAQVSPNEPDKFGETPIWKAIGCAETRNPVEKARLLVKMKASISPGKDGKTLLHHAAQSGTIEALKYCVEKLRINLDSKDNDGNTPLLCIMYQSLNLNLVKKAKLLIDYGANIPTGNKKETLLHRAAKNGTVEALKYCVEELGIDIDCKDEDGKTPLLSIMLDRCYSRSEVEKARILVLSGANVRAKLNPNEFVDEVMQLQTLLHLALFDYGDSDSAQIFEFVKLLLENGANVNERSLAGWTAIQIAKKKSGDASLELVNLLKEFGAVE